MRQRVGIFVAVLSVILLIGGMADAQNRKGAFFIGPHIGGYIFDSDQDINSDPVYGVNLGYNITETIGIELLGDWIETDTGGMINSSRVEALIPRVDILYHFLPDTKFTPYLAAGGGAINLNHDPGVSNDTDAIVGYGAGAKYFFNESLAFRADIRHLIDVEDDNHNNIIYTLGLNYIMGGVVPPPPVPPDSDGDGVPDSEDACPDTPAGAQVDSKGCPLDSDGDGVYDYLDKCPGTPAGVQVDSKGCPLDSDGDGVYDSLDKCPGTPAGVQVDSTGCPLDSDGDGVYDSLDKCPDTPAGAPVDSTGCPLDSDGDGVFDYMDKCPGTLAGITVDSVGCPVPIKEKVSIDLKVEFATNSARIEDVFAEHLQKVINFLTTYPDAMATIEGHTDSKGSEKYNQKLSQKRADSVMRYLAARGVNPFQLKAVGHGESRPIADNGTKEGRQKNRRVVAVISTTVTK